MSLRTHKTDNMRSIFMPGSLRLNGFSLSLAYSCSRFLFITNRLASPKRAILESGSHNWFLQHTAPLDLSEDIQVPRHVYAERLVPVKHT